MTLRVGMADYAAGRLCAGVAEEVMADGGVVIALMDEQPSKASLARFDGFRETLRRRNERLGASDARSIEVAVHRVPSSSPADPRLLRAAAQAPRVQLAVDFTERSFEQLLVALAGTSADQRVRLVTFDHSDRALEAIELGELLAIVTLDPFQCGYHSVCRMSHFQCCGRLVHPALGRGSILLVPQVVRRGDVAEFRAKSRG